MKLCSCIHAGKLEGLIEPQAAGQLDPNSSTVNGPVAGAGVDSPPVVPGVAVWNGPVVMMRFSGGPRDVLPDNDGPPAPLDVGCG